MARRKKPEQETQDQTQTRHLLEAIANHATRSEKTAWLRKRKNMEQMVGKLRPLEDKILEIQTKMRPIYDDIAVLRKEMVDDCIHPFDMLVVREDGLVSCKFCNKLMSLKQ